VTIDSLRNLAKRHLPPGAQRVAERWVMTARRFRPLHRFSFSERPAAASESPYSFPISNDNALEALGAKYAPTKRLHNYLPFYWMHFRDIRFEVRNVLEIGVQTDRSIRMWEEFFPNATIWGLDIDPACERFAGDRRRIVIGDQGDRACLRRVVEAAGGCFDIVIDDGSHRVEHQLATFEFLFPNLSDHGIYVVEDTGGCVGDPGLATVRSLETLVENIMYWPRGFRPSEWPALSEFPDDATWVDTRVIGVAFYRWIVFVMRGKNPGDNPYLGANRDRSAQSER
jgi:hypothetical protein